MKFVHDLNISSQRKFLIIIAYLLQASVWNAVQPVFLKNLNFFY